MSLKEKLQNLRNKLNINNNEDNIQLTNEESNLLDEIKTTNKKINLNDKVDSFINWYYENMLKDKYTKLGEFQEPKKLRDFIEKMSIWYELRYPDYEINKILPCTGDESTDINQEMFINNPYLEDVNEEIDYFNWSEFYNISAFFNSLPQEEKQYLRKPKYPDLIYIDKSYLAHLHLSSSGAIEQAEGVGLYTQFEIMDEELEEMNIEQLISLFEEKNIYLPRYNEIIPAVTTYQKKSYFYEELLNCVMYRIIERGRDGFGPRRAFLFAKEFKRNIDIPMIYGLYYGKGQREFVNEYLKSGGKKDLECYFAYLLREKENKKLDIITIEEFLKNARHNAQSKYTKEEQLLGEKIINILNSQINEEELKEEQIKADRIARKLKKSKQTNKK